MGSKPSWRGLLLLAALTVSADAAVQLPAFFSQGMVLQRDRPLPIWGHADAGTTVTLRIAHQQQTAVADATGRWEATLEALHPGPALELSISAAGDDRVITDVLVGEVFLCSGQSNMAMTLSAAKRAPGVEADIAGTDLPEVRFFQAPWSTFAREPQADVKGSWRRLSSADNAGIAAAPFYFAREMHGHLHIPIGILRASHAGGPIEAKMPLAALLGLPCARDRTAAALARLATPLGEAEERQRHAAWQAAVTAAQEHGDHLPPEPKPGREVNGAFPAADWNGVIAPLIRYGKRGVAWYQGEHNAGNARDYAVLLHALIASWRDASGDPDLPFVIVQLPRYGITEAERSWPILREAQLRTALAERHAGLVVTIDGGEQDNIHPADKRMVGERMALEMRRLAFGEAVSGHGPLFSGMTRDGASIAISFHPCPGPLQARPGPGPALAGFAIAGEDHVFQPASARIVGDQVVVSSSQVPRPVAVRYAWGGFPAVSLYDAGGLPASPFRSDDWAD